MLGTEISFFFKRSKPNTQFLNIFQKNIRNELHAPFLAYFDTQGKKSFMIKAKWFKLFLY